MKRFGSIYKITNLINGKIYIGQTTQDVEYRFSQHKRDKRSGRHLFLSITSYGSENFLFEEIFVCQDRQSLDFYETFFINHFNSFTPNGYNLTMGGEKKGVIGEETRRKMSQAKLGTKVQRTKTWSTESRMNKSKAQGGKPIIAKCLITGNTKHYDFINQAENDGFNNSEIYRVIKGQRKSHKNHTFYYANQSGSPESKNSEHAQRIGIETAKAE